MNIFVNEFTQNQYEITPIKFEFVWKCFSPSVFSAFNIKNTNTSYREIVFYSASAYPWIMY